MSTVTEKNQECILKGEEYGNPISAKLSNLLKKHTTNNDRANAAKETGVGTSTVRDVVGRSNALTESNALAIAYLIIQAKDNCIKAKNDLKELNKIFKTEK